MAPKPTAVPVEAVDLYTGYLDWLAAREVGNKTFYSGARSFLARFPDPQAWARLPLEQRHRGTTAQLQPFLNFLMLHGHLRPGYDYLLDRKFHAILRDAPAEPARPRSRPLHRRCRDARVLVAGPHRHGLAGRGSHADRDRAAARSPWR